jgi:hypothetical protein
MKHLSFSKLLLMLLMFEGSSALAQTSYPVAIGNQPCIVEAESGKALLKRRPTTSDPTAHLGYEYGPGQIEMARK